MELLAAYCLKGHHVGTVRDNHYVPYDITITEDEFEGEQLFSSFCVECGEPVVERCSSCGERFPPHAKYCGGCGNALPWTETGLEAARQFTEGIGILTPDEKATLNASFKDLTTDSAVTPSAASRVRAFAVKVGPKVGGALLDIGKSLATEMAKKWL